jgi:hypothetical protein
MLQTIGDHEMAYTLKTEHGRVAAAQRDVAENAAKFEAQIDARLARLAAENGLADTPEDHLRLQRIAKADKEFQELVFGAYLAERISLLLLADGYNPVIGEPGEPIQWRRPG